ncbi:MAG: TAXI family TRAP transporter solute-binding subunit [Pseudomonadota bacterium]
MRNITFAAAAAFSLAAGAAQAEDTTLKMATIEPSLSAAITMATFANIVNDNIEGLEIEVSGGGAATLHMVEVARGNLDISMTSPVVYNLMSAGKRMYAKTPEAPELAKNLKLLMWYPYGAYHFAVRADSDIQTLDDLEGATVFLGPTGGGAFNGARGWIEATTGLVEGEDYEAIKSNWATGFQAFLDGKIDMYTNGCLDPCGQFIQFTETESVRFLQPESWEGEAVTKFLGKFRFLEELPAGLYENQTNTDPVMSWGTHIGIAVRGDLDEEMVYQMTKAFWENIDQVTSDAPWASRLDVNDAAVQRGLHELHPGAARYYREAGVIN